MMSAFIGGVVGTLLMWIYLTIAYLGGSESET
jgi:hypothetical protein